MTAAIVNSLLGGFIFLIGLRMIDKMDADTSAGIRWGVVLTTVGGFFVITSYVWKWEEWVDTALLGGVATYMFANLRHPLFIPEHINPQWRKRGAILLLSITVLSILFAWGWAGAAEPPPPPQTEEDKAVNRTVDHLWKIHQFCAPQGCQILRRADYEAMVKELETLRKRNPSPAGCGWTT